MKWKWIQWAISSIFHSLIGRLVWHFYYGSGSSTTSSKSRKIVRRGYSLPLSSISFLPRKKFFFISLEKNTYNSAFLFRPVFDILFVFWQITLPFLSTQVVIFKKSSSRCVRKCQIQLNRRKAKKYFNWQDSLTFNENKNNKKYKHLLEFEEFVPVF